MLSATLSTEIEDVMYSDVLPALPHSALAIVRYTKELQDCPYDLPSIIESDPGLMGQFLSFINANENDEDRYLCINQAILKLGTKETCDFAMWNVAYNVTPNPRFGPYRLKSLWQDALRRASMARAIAGLMELEHADDVFAATLFQDMAVPLLLQRVPEEHIASAERHYEDNRRVSNLGRSMFGWSHADAANILAERWCLPGRFVRMSAQHRSHLEEMLSAGAYMFPNACIALGQLLPKATDTSWDSIDHDQFVSGFERLTNLPAETLTELFWEVDQASVAFADILRLKAPASRLGSLLGV